eukprot:7095417-Prymnesium_polylepis.1
MCGIILPLNFVFLLLFALFPPLVARFIENSKHHSASTPQRITLGLPLIPAFKFLITEVSKLRVGSRNAHRRCLDVPSIASDPAARRPLTSSPRSSLLRSP